MRSDDGKVYPRGGRWYVDIRIGGRRIRRSAGKTRLEAERELLELQATKERVARRGVPAQTPPPAPRGSRLTVAAAVDRYIQHLRDKGSRPRTVKSALTVSRPLKRLLGQKPADTLRRSDVSKFCARRREDGLRPPTINQALRLLKASLRLAVDDSELDRLPCPIKLLREARPAPTILSAAQIRDLLDAAAPRVRIVLLTAAHTGMRNSELRALLWRDVELAEGVIHICSKPEAEDFAPKNHAERTIDCSPALIRALRLHRLRLANSSDSDWVFQRNEKTGSRWPLKPLCAAVRTAFEDADLFDPATKPGLHMLRRSFASLALANGTDIETVRDLGGWSGLGVVERYVASTNELRKRAVLGISDALEG
ncbi:MAG: site-specific integrase [Myxococcota bacterium]